MCFPALLGPCCCCGRRKCWLKALARMPTERRVSCVAPRTACSRAKQALSQTSCIVVRLDIQMKPLCNASNLHIKMATHFHACIHPALFPSLDAAGRSVCTVSSRNLHPITTYAWLSPAGYVVAPRFLRFFGAFCLKSAVHPTPLIEPPTALSVLLSV